MKIGFVERNPSSEALKTIVVVVEREDRRRYQFFPFSRGSQLQSFFHLFLLLLLLSSSPSFFLTELKVADAVRSLDWKLARSPLLSKMDVKVEGGLCALLQ